MVKLLNNRSIVGLLLLILVSSSFFFKLDLVFLSILVFLVFFEIYKNKFLNEITGTWVHRNKDGSYRKKVMTRNTEQTTFFDKNNAIVEKRDPWPYRVEVIHGQPRFTVYSPNGSTWNAAVNLINGQWFEQHRAKFNGVWTATDPNVYWTYDKED